MNTEKMILFCKNFVSLIPSEKKTKSFLELQRTVIEGKPSNPSDWFSDKVIEELFKACPVTIMVYKFVRDNQNFFAKETEYTIDIEGRNYIILSSEHPRELIWHEKVYAEGVDYYFDPDAVPLYTRIKTRKWTVKYGNSDILKEFFVSDEAVKKDFIVMKNGSSECVIRGAFISEQYGSNSLTFLMDFIEL